MIVQGQITIIDLSDSRQLTAYLTSSQPKIQLFNPNNNSYSPNWINNNVVITPTIYINSTSLPLTSPNLTFTWKRKVGSNNETDLTENETVSNGVLTISDNKLSSADSDVITYICYVNYTDTPSNISLDTRLTIEYTLLANAHDAKTVVINGEQVFKYDGDNQLISDDIITLTATASNVNITKWQYKSSSGDFTDYPTTSDNTDITSSVLNVKDTHEIFNDDIAIIKVVTDDDTVYDIISITKLYDGYQGEDGIGGLSLILGNEAEIIPCTSDGLVYNTVTVTIPFTAYKGIEQIPATCEVGTLPSGATLDSNTSSTANSNGSIILSFVEDFDLNNNNNGNIQLTFTVDELEIIKYFSWSKAIKGETGQDGSDGENAVLFSIYAPDGTVIKNNEGYLTLTAVGYDGANRIGSTLFYLVDENGNFLTDENSNQLMFEQTTSDSLSYQWSKLVNGVYQNIPDATGNTITVEPDDVSSLAVYKCIMTYKGVEYTDTITIEDKSDPITSAILSSGGSIFKNGTGDSIIRCLLYTSNGETDNLYTENIGEEEPDNPSNGTFWYKVDKSNKTITLMKYEGSSWTVATEVQKYTYKWYRLDENGIPLDTNTPFATGKLIYVDYTDLENQVTLTVEVELNGVVIAASQFTITEVTDGLNGNDGVSITSNILEYYHSTSPTELIGGTWSSEAPEWENGKYIWIRIKTQFSDNTESTTSPINVSGSFGEDGRGITSTVMQYYQSTSSTELIGGNWSTDEPEWDAAKYIWTKLVITYDDESTEETEPICVSGRSGNDAVVGSLSNDNHTLTCDVLGNPITLAGATTTMSVFEGLTDASDTWNFAISKNNCDGTLTNNNRTFTLTTMSSDNAYVEFTATKSGFSSIIKRFTISKSKAGAVGEDATAYWLITDTTIIRKNSDYSLSPTTVTFTGRSKTGNEDIINYSGRFVISESTNGTSYTTKYTSSINESSKTYTPSSNDVVSIKCVFYQAGGTTTILDEQTVQVISNGKDGSDGVGVESIIEEYYLSTSNEALSGGSWSSTKPEWENGKYIWTRSVITLTDKSSNTTEPICVTGEAGNDGVGVQSVDVQYYKSISSTELSGGSWSTTSPTWESGKYIWQKTVVTYTDGHTDETNPICVTGAKGQDGISMTGITEHFLASPLDTGVTTDTSGWSTSVPELNDTNRYLWNYETINFSSGNPVNTQPRIIGMFSQNGNDGVGIENIVDYYLATSLSSNVTVDTEGWTTTPQNITNDKKYLWNYTVINYTEGSPYISTPVIIGAYGDRGVNGVDTINAILSNESHTFIADSNGNAIATTITNIVSGYKGATKVSTTIGTITGTPAGMSIAINNNNSINTSLTITITTDLTSTSGVVNIPITVDGTVITKQFSYSLSIAGKDGNDGESASVAIINATSQVFKSASGASTYTPDQIVLSPILQSCDYQKWQYSTDGGFTWANVVSGDNGLTIETIDNIDNCLTIASDCSLYTTSGGETVTHYLLDENNNILTDENNNILTYAETTTTPLVGGVTAIVFKLVTDIDNIFDTITITRLKDGEDGASGIGIIKVTPYYYLSNSNTSLIGGTWETTVPTWSEGKYIWFKQRTTLTNNNYTETDAICLTGTSGETGKGISNITPEYYLSTSKTELVGGSWSSTPPAWENNKYIWTRNKIEWNNPSSVTYTTPICDSSWEAINDLVIGGSNLLLQSNILYEGTDYPLAKYTMTRKMTAGTIYSCRIWGSLGEDKTNFSIYLDTEIDDEGTITNMGVNLGTLQNNDDGTHTLTFTGQEGTNEQSVIYVFPTPQSATSDCSITRIKLEYGNKHTDWSAAPEETITNDDLNSAREEIISGYTKEIQNTKDGILTEISATYTTIGEMNSIKNQITEINTDTLQKFESITNIVNSVENAVTGLTDQTEILNMFQYDKMTATLTIQTTKPEEGSSFAIKITPTEMGFYEGNDKVAYLSNKQLYINQAVVVQSLELGNFRISDDPETGFSID